VATAAHMPEVEHPPLHGARLAVATVAIATAAFMELLDMTIVNVSVPSIAGSLGVTPSEGTWTVSSYMLAAAVMQPLTGWIGRRYGEVRTFLTSISLFMLMSAICGLATSLPMLVAARLLQGLVSGPMMSLAQALLMRNYPPEKRGMAVALYAMVVIVAPIIGPIAGGWITDNLSWPWLFYINLPVGAFSAITSWVILRKRESSKVRIPIDVVGLMLLLVGVGSLQYMLDNGNELDWFGSWIIIAAGTTAAVSLTLLLVWELTDDHPVIDLHLFGRRNFRVGVIIMALSYFSMSATNILFPLWLQTTVGYTATWAGLALAPVGLLAIIAAPIIGRNMQRLNLRLAASFAFLVFGVAVLWSSTLNEKASFSQFALPRIFLGMGMPFFFLPINQILLSGVPPHQLASAAGLSNFCRTMAGSISTAVSVWIWSNRTYFHHARLTERVTETAPGWLQYQAQLNAHGLKGEAALRFADRILGVQASTLAINDVYFALGGIFFILIPMIWITRPPFGARALAKAPVS
jgi:MFS transporter, DHA2 family, multidrug resistance protein